MSYILDALKKSDKERQRGAVPGISTVHVPPRPETTRRPVWPYVLLAVLLLNVGAIVWLLGIRKPADQNAGALQRSVQPAPAVTPPPTEGTSLADRSPAESDADLQSRPEEGAPQKGAATPGARAAQSPQPPQSSLHQKKGETTKEQKQAGCSVARPTTPTSTALVIPISRDTQSIA